MKSRKEKPYKVYTDYDVIEAYDELFLLLEEIKIDLQKSVLNGSKTSGIRARRGLKAAKELVGDILKNCIPSEKAAKASKKPHGNAMDPVGIKIMLKKRNIKFKGDKKDG